MPKHTRKHYSKKTSATPERAWARSGWLYGVFFVLFVGVLWLFWGRQFMCPRIILNIDSDIDQSDERVDFTVLRSVIHGVNSRFLLPQKLYFHITKCDDANAYYDSETDEIILCDELIDDFVGSFQVVYDNPVDVRDAATNAFIFIAFHELGHALIDILDLPITGKEEDVADQLSMYVLVNSFEDGAQFVLDGATWFGVTSEQYHIDEGDFADVHSLDVQRYYTLACWVYGSSPARFGTAVFDGGLPSERADTCEHEYSQFMRSWDKLLEDHIR